MMRALAWMLLLAAAGTGCSAGAGNELAGNDTGGSGGAGGKGAGGNWISGSGGQVGAGGQIAVNGDAGAIRSDAGPGQVLVTLSGDAPVINWDTRTCSGCNDTGGASGASGQSGGSSGSGGLANSGGKSASGGSASGGSSASTSAGSGGASAAGGSSSVGGAPGTGGRANTGTGGARGAGGMSGTGSAGTTGGGPDASPADLPPGFSDGAVDVVTPPPDAGVGTPDAWETPDASAVPCVTQIRAIVPATSDLESYPLVSGNNMRVVLRAEILSGGPAAPVWDWQASRDGTTIPAAAIGQEDPAAAAFPITSKGLYTFRATARSSLCSATVRPKVSAPADLCPDCVRYVILRAAPPPDTNLPVQSGFMGLAGSPPFSQANIVLDDGVSVLVSPSVAGTRVSSYVRISNLAGELVSDGLADERVGFGTQLLEMANGELLRYDVLAVPIDGPGDDVVAATAPQLFSGKTAREIKDASFSLSGGKTVTGTISSAGQPVVDARVILTNRDPNALSELYEQDALIFSSVGRTGTDGRYTLHAQPGQYWVSISPPNGGGLPEALAPVPVNLAGDSDISLQWMATAQAALTLSVYDANNLALDKARVRLTSAQPTKVGTMTVNGGGAQDVIGNVRAEGTTSSGFVTFANLPADASYNALIVPAFPSVSAATTVISVTVPAGGATLGVYTARQSRISGQLLAAGSAPDWTGVRVVAYDRSMDAPEPPQTVYVRADGSYDIGVSPGRAYVVLVVPTIGSGLARTFVGPGILEGSEFVLPQEVPAVMPWSATVMDEYQRTLPGTALQIFCNPSWPRCVDWTVPLAESTAEAGGAFLLELPAAR